MKLLIIGGTIFLGRAIAESALQAGHLVTLFHRGKSCPDFVLEGAEILHGDRTESFEVLADREFDAVIDTCGYVPRHVRFSAESVRSRTDKYVFISTISVYASNATVNDESSMCAVLPDPTTESVTGETYGGLKALCEEEVRSVYGERALIIRPGLIVGANDPTDRFTYWLLRSGQAQRNSGIMLVPGNEKSSWQWIDARDLADWILHCLAHSFTGTYNATGTPILVAEMVRAAKLIHGYSEHDAPVPRFISDEELLLKNAQPWSEIPMWVPDSLPEFAAFHKTSIQKALDHGLRFRSMQETFSEIISWAQRRGSAYQLRAGFSEEREAELLAK